MHKIGDIIGDDVGHLAIRGVPPAVLDDVKLGRIGRQACHMDARTIEVTKPLHRFAVSAAAIPDHQQWVLEMPVQLLHERQDIGAGEMPRGQRTMYFRGNANARNYSCD